MRLKATFVQYDDEIAAGQAGGRILIAIFLIALILRLLVGLASSPSTPYTDTGGDSAWYLANGYTLVTGQQPGTMTVDVSTLGVPPVYLIILGIAQAILPPEAAVIAVRILQAILSAVTCVLAYRLALALTGWRLAGLLSAGALAVSPAFIVEASIIGTETVYIFLVTAALTLYTAHTGNDRTASGWPFRIAIVAFLLGVATLTRAVFLLFPIGLAVHLLLSYAPKAALKRAVLLLVIYAMTVGTWTVYNLVRWDRFVIAGEGLAAFFYIGATSWDSPQDVDARLAEAVSTEASSDIEDRQEAYLAAAEKTIQSDPAGYLRKRVTELAGAYLQPHGTVFFPGESLKELALTWLREDRTLSGLAGILRGDAFWPKLAIYVFHYTALAAGLAGMWLYRRRWRVALPLLGFIVYTTLVHLVLLALPRYIFPTEVFWWVFAGAALARLPVVRGAGVPAGARQLSGNV